MVSNFLLTQTIAMNLGQVHACLSIARGQTPKKEAMTNLDSVLKSRDISLPTKVHLVKAMVFPVVMYGCECWMAKKAEH